MVQKNPVFVKLQKKWHDLKVDTRVAEISLFNWNEKPEFLKRKASATLKILNQFKACETFPRADYRELVHLSIAYLEGVPDGFHFVPPGAAHEARFMGTSLYVLKLVMTRNILSLMSEEKIQKLEELADFIAVYYVPYFLQTSLTTRAPALDHQLIQDMKQLSLMNLNLGNSIISSLYYHGYYLTQELVVLALADETLAEDVRGRIALKMIETPNCNPERNPAKPNIPEEEMCEEFDLPDYVGPD